MNILFYIPTISQKDGGIKNYATGILNLLTQERESTNLFYIYHNIGDKDIIEIVNHSENFILVQDSDIKIRKNNFFRKWINRYKKYILKKYIYDEPIIEKLCNKYKIDIIHSPYQYIPDTNKYKLITTLHDIQEIHFPEFFSPEERANRAVNYLKFLKKADIVIVSYQHVKNDIIKYFNIDDNKIKILLSKIDSFWFDKFTDDDITPLPNKITSEYILYPANFWQHKNHEILIKAIACLRNDYNIHIKLVCTGNKEIPYFKHLQTLTKKLEIEDQILFIGIVDELTLFNLYKQAQAVVIPTLYEAGSFPLYESIMLKVPVICSNVTSLPETIGNKKYIFNPYDLNELTEKIKLICFNEEFRKKNIDNLRVQQEKILKHNPLPLLNQIYKSLI